MVTFRDVNDSRSSEISIEFENIVSIFRNKALKDD